MYAQNRVMSEKGFITLAFILGIVLLSASVVGGSFYLKKNNPELLEKLTAFTKPNTTSQATNSANVTSESTKKIVQNQPQNNTLIALPLIAFVEDLPDKTASISSGQVRIYDLSKRKLVEIDQSLIVNNDALPGLGPLSPDGKYLPVYYFHPEKRPVFFYNLQDNKAIKVLETRKSGSSPNYSFWLDNQRFAYDYDIDNSGGKTILTINQKGEQGKIPLPSPNLNSQLPLIFTNDHILASYHNEQPQITVDGISIPGNPKGQIVGLLDSYLVTLESPLKPDLFNTNSNDNNSNLNQTLQSNISEQAKRAAIEQALRPKGNWLLHFYRLPEGALERSIIAQDTGWLVRDALIRPVNKTIVIHQQDKSLPPYLSRYTEINPQKQDQRNIISQEAGFSYAENIMNGNSSSFEITQDGAWLIGLQPSGSKGLIGEDLAQIIAWNIDTKERVVICQKENINCHDLRVYNPSKLRVVSSEETVAKSSQH